MKKSLVPSGNPVKNIKNKIIPLSIFALTSASLFLSPSIAMAANEPLNPNPNDSCGVANDTTILPASPDINWEQITPSGRQAVTGIVSTNGELTQTFAAVPSLNGDTFPDGSTEKTYILNFTDTSCNIVVPVVAPTFADNFGSINDTYTIPSATGNAYFINNILVNAGTYAVTDPNMVVIAVPMPGYSFPDGAQTQYLGNFTSNPVIPDIPVDPYAPDFIDMSGTANDVYVIPADNRVSYLVNGVPLQPGSYPANGTVSIEVQAENGYVLNDPANSSYAYTYSTEITDLIIAYPDSVTRSDQPGKSQDNYTVPSSVGVEYVMNGKVVNAGTYSAEGNVVIEAKPLSGYMFIPQADTLFDYTFSNEVQFSKPFVVGGNTIFIPEIEGLEYSLNGVVTSWGYYDITHDSTVTVRALPGFTTPPGSVLAYNFTFIPTEVTNPTIPTTPTTPQSPVTPSTPVTETPSVVTPRVITETNGDTLSDSLKAQDSTANEDNLANTAFTSEDSKQSPVMNSILLTLGGLMTYIGAIALRKNHRKA